MSNAKPDDAPAGAVARGSSFFAGMRILPAEQRAAMYAIYAFCRIVDDIADGADPRPEKHARLAEWRGAIEALYAGAPDAKTAALVGPIREFGLEKADFLAVIDGMAMDAERDIRAPDRATFDLYCDRVAVAVGRLSVRVFRLEREAGEGLAHHLGNALQITNILRDIDEDNAIGRLYLPREALDAAGITTSDPAAIIADPAVDRVGQTLAIEARAHFAAAEAIMARVPARAVRAPRLMAAAYRPLLERLARRGFAAPRARLRVAKWRLAIAALAIWIAG
jgi:phytoene synthase